MQWIHSLLTLYIKYFIHVNRLCLFPACEFGWWGTECANKCECSDEGSERCDKVRACVCKAGYTGTLCEVDINECEQNPNICGDRQQCVNTVGSYVCVCRQGFVRHETECQGTKSIFRLGIL